MARAEIDQTAVPGGIFGEIVFFHKDSKTLILADTIINLELDKIRQPWRFAAKLTGMYYPRGQIFFGSPDLKNYTIEADVLSEGNRRKMSEAGIINQRYAIILKGNAQELEVNSNQERVKVAVPFKWSANMWYHIKARVDVAADGSGVVRAKAWKKGEAEPEAWTIEVPHKKAHAHGSPGLFGFSPTDMRVCIDNVKVTAN